MLCCNQDPFLVLPENTLLERKQALEAVCFGDNDEYHKPKVMVKSFHYKESQLQGASKEIAGRMSSADYTNILPP